MSFAHNSIGLVALAAASQLALAGPGASYDVRLAIQSRNANLIQYRGVPLVNDVSGGTIGLHPHEGPHLIAGDPTFYTRHQAELIKDINDTIPDVNFSGVICIDHEAWWPSWEWSSSVQPAWTNYIKTQRPDLLAGKPDTEWDAIIQAEYKKTVRQYYEFTASIVRQQRPKAKLSWYGIPLRSYWIFNGVPQYGVDLARYREIHEQEMKWYFDLVDVLCPSIYPVYSVAVPAGQNQVEPSGNEAYILGMVGESVRVSRGKPVYPFFLLKYHPSAGAYANQFINSINLRQGLEIPRQVGAAGLVIWDFFYDDTELAAWQNYYDTTARDVIYGVIYPGTGSAPNPPAAAPGEPTQPEPTEPDPDQAISPDGRVQAPTPQPKP